MQYPAMNIHGPELDCYSNSNKNCMESIFMDIIKSMIQKKMKRFNIYGIYFHSKLTITQ